MAELEPSIRILLPLAALPRNGNKKADVAEHPEVFHHVGLLVNEPLGTAELPFS
jgi:hypothetical protein